jgi:16S rRNA (cytosine1402-N4)-methyltransferase
MSHIPVLLKEVLQYLQPSEKIIDGTVGDGGYIKEILKINPKSKVLGIDLDQTSLDKLNKELAKMGLSQRTTLVQGNFSQLGKIAEDKGFVGANAVILDLGFSSSQLDDPKRGLSFQTDGPLDMRFDPSGKNTAGDILNTYEAPRLAAIFRNYGEERNAYKIATEIVRARKEKPIQTTGELFEIIKLALPKPLKHKASDFARRIFQALRIEVNDELNNLKKTLPQILEILAPGGRMVIISFHSLEDRIVKEFMVQAARGCICPPDFPQCVCGKNPMLKILTKKPVRASMEEAQMNSRSIPAKLRVSQKVTN